MATGPTKTLYPVKDIAAAKAVYSALLGIEPMADAPYYGGDQNGDQHIGLGPNGHAQGMTGPVSYYEVDDIAAGIQALQAAGATVVVEPNDVGGGMLVATLTDADGNPIGLTQSGQQG